jgi:hypothetical protein
VILLWLLWAALLLAMPVLAQPAQVSAVPAQSGAQAEPPSSMLSEIRVQCTPASQAAELIGKHGCVSGRVFQVTTARGGATHVSLCPRRSKCSFRAVALARDRGAVGDLSSLGGNIVAVVGQVTQFHGHPQIIVRDRQQIQVAAGNPPLPSDIDPANPACTQSSGKGKHGRAQ